MLRVPVDWSAGATRDRAADAGAPADRAGDAIARVVPRRRRSGRLPRQVPDD
jgi:hypothetical protein